MKYQKVFIAGYYGFGNIGDETILASICASAREYKPNLQISVSSGEPDTTEILHRVTAIRWNNIEAIINEIEQSSAVIFGGGGIFHDYWGAGIENILTSRHSGIGYYTTFALIAAILGKPLLICGVGVGPLFTEEGKALTKAIFEQANYSSVRDIDSLRLLSGLGLEKRRIHVSADPALIYSQTLNQVERDNESPVLGVSLRNWDMDNVEEYSWGQSLSVALDKFIELHGGSVVFIPFQKGSQRLTDDIDISSRIISMMKYKSSAILSTSDHSPQNVTDQVAKCDYLLGMRLHSIILAAIYAIPVVAISYDPKVASIMKTLGQETYSLDISSISELSNKLNEMVHNSHRIERALSRRITKLQALARKDAMSWNKLLDEDYSPFISASMKSLVGTVMSSKTTDDENILRVLGKRTDDLQLQIHKYDELANLQAATLADLQILERKYSQLAENKSETELQLAALINEFQELELSKSYLVRELEFLKTDAEAKDMFIAETLSSRAWRALKITWRIRSVFENVIWGYPKSTVKMCSDALSSGWHTTRKSIKSLFENALRNFNSYAPYRLVRRLQLIMEQYSFSNNSTVTLYSKDPTLISDYPNRQLITSLSESDPSLLEISLVVTVKDEEATIEPWFERILSSTCLPDEIVIVDGGSSDNTLELIGRCVDKAPFPVHIMESAGANIAQGRNVGINQACHDTIIVTDLGCIPKFDWLELITYPFHVDSSIEIVAGYYEIEGNHGARYSDYFIQNLENVDVHAFIPSSRSIGFKKEAWKKVAGYPEWLSDAGEDTYFGFRLKEYNSKWAFIPEAIVSWQGPKTPVQLFKTIFRYSRGDAEASLFTRDYYDKSRIFISTLVMPLVVIALVLLLPTWINNSVIIFSSLAIFFLIMIKPTRLISRIHNKNSRSNVLHAFIILAAQSLGFYSGLINRIQMKRHFIDSGKALLKKIQSSYEHSPRIIIYPHTHPWNGMFQRPHQFARSFAKLGYMFFFCDRFEFANQSEAFIEVEKNLFICNVPIEVFVSLQDSILYIGSPRHSRIHELFPKSKIVYDHYDDLSVSSGRMIEHLDLVNRASIVVASSIDLKNRLAEYRKEVPLIPNAVDYLYVMSKKQNWTQSVIKEKIGIRNPTAPIIGYSGALASWVDFELIRFVARQRAHYQIVLIGADYDGSLAQSGISSQDNIHWLGYISYDELFQYIWEFDVGIIPFKINQISLAASPIKLFEYFACEKPVISIDLPECRKYPEVLIASTPDEFLNQLEYGLSVRNDKTYKAKLRNIAKANDWMDRAMRIDALMTS